LASYDEGVSTMNVSLTDDLREFVDAQVDAGSYSSTSEYIRDLIRRDRDRGALKALLLEGAASPAVGEFDGAYFERLRSSVRATR
jgi:antitoxin ParD1/3/4